MYNLAFRYYESELHISDENLALLKEIMTLLIEEAESLVEDELDVGGVGSEGLIGPPRKDWNSPARLEGL